VKRDNKWMSKADSDQLTEDHKALDFLDGARSKLSSREFRLAWLDVSQAVPLTKNLDIIKQIGDLQKDIYFKYLQYLEMMEEWLKTQVDYQERRVARADV